MRVVMGVRVVTDFLSSFKSCSWRCFKSAFSSLSSGSTSSYLSSSRLTFNGNNYALLQDTTYGTFLNTFSGSSVYIRVNNANVASFSSGGEAISGYLTVSSYINGGGWIVQPWVANSAFSTIQSANLTPATGNYALMQDGSGTTYLNGASGTLGHIRINNADIITWSATAVGVTPTFYANGINATSGIFQSAAGGPALNCSVTTANAVAFSVCDSNVTTNLTIIPNSNQGTTTTGYVTYDIAGTTGRHVFWDDLQVTGTAYKPGGGSWTATSDLRVKRDVADFEEGLDELAALRPVWFSYNGKAKCEDDGRRHVGLVAQEAMKTCPHLVSASKELLDEDPDPVLILDPSSLTFMLINAVKALDARVQSLESQLSVPRRTRQRTA